jgi:hypothetical protein
MMKYWKIVLLLAVVLLLFLIGGGSGYRYLGGAHSLDVVGEASMHGGDLDLPGSGWSNYGNDAGGHRFSSAAQITADNVADLEMAWQFSTADLQKKQSAIVEFFADVEDPRRDNANRRHDLLDIIVIAVMSVICGADSWTEVAMGGEAKEKWLRTFLTLRNGIPSHDTFGRVFSLIDPVQFRTAFGRFVAAIAELAPREVVAVDGKTVRRSHDRSNDRKRYTWSAPGLRRTA